MTEEFRYFADVAGKTEGLFDARYGHDFNMRRLEIN